MATKKTEYRYKVKDRNNRIHVGRAQAADAVAVRRILQDRGYTIVSIVENKGLSLSFNRVSAKDRSIMYKELSTMLKAGVGITQAIEIAAETPSKKLSQVLTEVAKSLENGFALSVAMSGHPKVFPEVEVGVIRAGEATGNLSRVLEDLSLTTARSAEFISRVRGAMIYPAFIFVVMIIVGSVIMTKVIPPIKTIFESTDSELPVSTKILLKLTDILIADWGWILVGLAVLAGLLKLFSLTKIGRWWFSSLALNFPVFGKLTVQVYLARFNRTLSLLVGAGVPIIQAVDIIYDTTTNVVFQKTLRGLRTSLEQGLAISSSLQRSRYFPRIMTQLLFVGQQTGDLGGSASTLAEYFENEVDAKLRTLSALIEPFVIVILGAAVAFIIISVLQPIYDLTGSF